jgi:hypothetical protein
MSESHTVCQECGDRADVHISDIVAGAAVMHHLCQLCADDFQYESGPRDRRSGMAAVIIVLGALVASISLFADALAFGGGVGFGWQQQAGLVVAGVLLLLGAVLRAPTVLIIGAFAGVLDVLADWLAFGSAPGFGRQQVVGTIFGGLLILFGVVLAKTRKRR